MSYKELRQSKDNRDRKRTKEKLYKSGKKNSQALEGENEAISLLECPFKNHSKEKNV